MSVSLRREGREAAIQFLFGADVNKLVRFTDEERVAAFRQFWALREKAPRQKTQDFAADLVQGVLKHLAEIDRIISRHVLNYELSRIAVVDRNVLRLAVYEMLHRTDIPPLVSLNEAIEIARKFGSEHSDQFVNGILDKVVKVEVRRPLRTAGENKPLPQDLPPMKNSSKSPKIRAAGEEPEIPQTPDTPITPERKLAPESPNLPEGPTTPTAPRQPEIQPAPDTPIVTG